MRLLHCLRIIIFLGFVAAPTYSNPLPYTLHGLKKGPLLSNVETHLNESLQRLSLPLNHLHIRSWYTETEQIIQKALAPFGYFSPRIQSKLVQQMDQTHAIYSIELGPITKITVLEVQLTGEGKHNSHLQRQISTHLPIQIGDAITTEAYQKTKQFLYEWVISQGYWDAKWQQHEVQIHHKTHTATVRLTLETGKQYTISRIHFSTSPLDLGFLNRYLPVQAGDPYSPSTLFHLQETLRNSDYFQTVIVQEDEKNKTNPYQVPLNIELTPLPLNRYTASFGISQDIGIRAQAGWLLRRVTNTGHRAHISAQISKVQNRIAGIYTIPGARPSIHQYHIQLIRTYEQFNKLPILARQIGLVSTRKHPTWSLISFLNYHFEKSNTTLNKSTYTLTPGIIWSKKHFLPQNLTQSGYKLNIRIQGALASLFSNTSFLQAEIQAAYLLPIETLQDHLILRTRFGYTIVTQPDRLPMSLRFYAGGNHSLRGYDDRELGPGYHVLAASVEYHRYLKENLYLNAYLDIGSVGHHLPLPQMKRGIGVGFIWRSSVGPLEFSLASALDKPGSPWSFVFNFGSDFL